jgi:hypothetical protein
MQQSPFLGFLTAGDTNFYVWWCGNLDDPFGSVPTTGCLNRYPIPLNRVSGLWNESTSRVTLLSRERAIMHDWYPVRLAPHEGTPVILWRANRHGLCPIRLAKRNPSWTYKPRGSHAGTPLTRKVAFSSSLLTRR